MMIWQYFIIGLIILAAIGFTAVHLYKFFTNPLRKCDGCSAGCGGCPVDELKQEILSKKKVQHSNQKK